VTTCPSIIITYETADIRISGSHGEGGKEKGDDEDVRQGAVKMSGEQAWSWIVVVSEIEKRSLA
jgi:hypothetical protein